MCNHSVDVFLALKVWEIFSRVWNLFLVLYANFILISPPSQNLTRTLPIVSSASCWFFVRYYRLIAAKCSKKNEKKFLSPFLNTKLSKFTKTKINVIIIHFSLLPFCQICIMAPWVVGVWLHSYLVFVVFPSIGCNVCPPVVSLDHVEMVLHDPTYE